MTIGNIKFSQLPELPLANITAATIAPVVENNINYKMSMANLTNYVSNSGNITATSVSASGNVTGSYILGNGSQLTGVVSSYGNANVAAYLPTYTGALAGANVSVSGNVTGAYVLGNGSQLTSISGASVTGTVANAAYATTAGSAGTATSATTAGTVTGNAQANITSVGTLTGLNASGAISTSGNVTGNYILGNGSQLTGLPAVYGNANVAAYLASGTDSSNIVTTGNVSGTYFLGNGSQLTGLPQSYGNANVAAYLPTYTGNITADAISTTGNITAPFYVGNGSLLTGVTASFPTNITGTTVSVTGNVTGGNILSLGIVSASANIISNGYILGNGRFLSGIDALAPNAFGNIVANGTPVLAPTANATLIMAAGNGIIMVGNAVSDTITISVDPAMVVNYANSAGTATSATTAVTATSATTAGTVTSPSQTAITSVGTLTSLTVSGFVTANSVTSQNFLTAGASSPFSRGTLSLKADTKANILATSGTAGYVVCVSDSPTYAGRLAYWTTTAPAKWRYVDDNTAVT